MQCDGGMRNAACGFCLAKFVVSKFGTDNVFKIARKLAISIAYAKWFPVTLGEFDSKNKRITVNENAEIPFEKIIAHELGHYFLQTKFDLKTVTVNKEKFCDEFAEELLKNG
jgi:Zn-dependent peptidase ImmA (M78 family)